MSKKVLTGAMAAVMATGMVTPVMAETNETKTLAELHVAAFEAYNTAMKAAADKKDNATVQKLINEARKASAAFLAAYEKETGSKEHGDIPTWSTGLDSIQHPILAKIVDAIVAMDKNPETITQEKLNEVYSLLWNNLEDDSDNLAEEYLTGAEHGLSQASDTVQQKFNEKVVAAVEAAKTEKTAEAVEAAKALVEELSTALNPQLVEAAKVLGEEVAKVEEEISVVKIESVTAVGVKKLEVKFNKAVNESVVKFTIKKGSTPISVSKVTYSEDKTSAVLEIAGKLSKGDYTVAVTGVSEEALTSKVTVEDEKIANIEILSDIAIISTGAADEAKVGYKVENQYGEDITKTATGLTLTTNAKSSKLENGKIVLDNNDVDYKEGNKVTISILDAKTGTFTSKVVTISAKSTTSEIEITELYHKDDVILNTDNVQSEASNTKLLIDAKDQYGNSIVPVVDGDVVVTTSDASIINVGSFDVQKINGEDKTVLLLKAPTVESGKKPKAGKAIITIMSKTNGAMAKFEVVVKEGVKVNEFTMELPELLVEGETVTVPFTATDLEGNEITKAELLNSGVNFGTLKGNFTFTTNYLTNKAELTFTAPAEGTHPTVITTENGKVEILNIETKETAKATAIVGLDSSIATNVVTGEDLTIDSNKVKVIDQYGREFKGNTTINSEIVEGNEYISNSGLTFSGLKKGTATIKLSLKDVKDSEFTFATNVVEKADFVSYEIAEIGNIYDDVESTTKYNRDLVVYGVLANGKKAVVPSGWYTVLTNNNKLTYSVGKLDANGVVASNNKDVTVKVDVIIDGKDSPVMLSKDVTVTKATPVVTDVKVNDSVKNGAVVIEATSNTINASNINGLFKFKDQYGELKDSSNAIITITNVVDADKSESQGNGISVSNNGTSNVSVSPVTASDNFNATIRLDGYTTTLKVIVSNSK